MLQAKHIKHIEDTLKKILGSEYRIINIHGHKMQEAGLPDLIIASERFKQPIWIELKRSANDEPTMLQKYNLTNLMKGGFHTGVAFDDYVAPATYEIGFFCQIQSLEEFILSNLK